MNITHDGVTFASAHFIGIGGAGMSGIALVLHERGCKVTGSDLKESHYVRDLIADGIDVRVGHDAATIDEVKPDVVVISTAIPETNPELVRAFVRASSAPVTKRQIRGAFPDISEATVENALGAMVRAGEVEKLGGGRSTAYRWKR